MKLLYYAEFNRPYIEEDPYTEAVVTYLTRGGRGGVRRLA